MPVRIDEVSANFQGDQPPPQPETPSDAGQAQPSPLAQQDQLRRLWRKLEQRKARVKAD